MGRRFLIWGVGCGDGEHGAYFMEKGFDVVGIDLSDSFLEMARKKSLNTLKMDLEDLKFNDNSFDGIWAVTSLLHVPKSKINKVLGKLSDVLKSDGILYVCVKEGKGEKFVIDKEDSSTKRFFAFWKKDEFLDFTEAYFNLLDFTEVKVKNTTFLEFLFRKK